MGDRGIASAKINMKPIYIKVRTSKDGRFLVDNQIRTWLVEEKEEYFIVEYEASGEMKRTAIRKDGDNWSSRPFTLSFL
jgi:hypothetical protein